jgi:EAL domain-containing protein (putative c-di-GMP-specific phosphodiesterase class I)/ActR/RegA family two-component response regulator
MNGARVLVVDDDSLVRRSAARALENAGFIVVPLAEAQTAIEHVRRGGVDGVLSDIQMPGMDGIDLLRAVRALDSDLPVVLMTGQPALESAIPAVELGATLYLVKPLDTRALLAGMTRAVSIGALARVRRRAADLVASAGPGDRATLEARFDNAIATLHPVFQPIVDVTTRAVLAYEALLRTGEPEFPGPPAVLDAAERLGRVHELGRALRRAVAGQLADLAADVEVFVNLHPSDLLDPDLYDPAAPLSAHARRIVLEITERSSLDGVDRLTVRIGQLRTLGYRIAVDDLGAGYAGLTSVVRLQPEVVKLDMTLVRGCHIDDARRQVLRSMAELSRALGMRVVAEGVEVDGEAETLRAIGCVVQQGYRFARPGAPWPAVSW